MYLFLGFSLLVVEDSRVSRDVPVTGRSLPFCVMVSSFSSPVFSPVTAGSETAQSTSASMIFLIVESVRSFKTDLARGLIKFISNKANNASSSDSSKGQPG